MSGLFFRYDLSVVVAFIMLDAIDTILLVIHTKFCQRDIHSWVNEDLKVQNMQQYSVSLLIFTKNNINLLRVLILSYPQVLLPKLIN